MIPINIRVIAATNSDLLSAVESGIFRHDLYYRINVLNISIPPLRERNDDIPLLVRHYISLYNAQFNKSISSCNKDFISAFQNHDWKGNVRELMNYIMRIVILCDSNVLTAEDIAKSEIHLSCNPKKGGLDVNTANVHNKNRLNLEPGTLQEMEKDIIEWYMKKYDGNRVKVCNALNISRTTLWNKLKEM